MESQEITENIEEIYDRFRVPPNVREHMKLVAEVAEEICDKSSVEIDKEDVIAECLLHDIGNIAKFDFASPNQKDLMGEEYKNLEKWKKVQQEVFEEYGKDEHEVTLNMAKEIGVNKRVLDLLEKSEFINIENVIESNDIEAKICTYADLRVSPKGRVSMVERFDEAKTRYDDVDEDKIRLAFFLENEIETIIL